MSTARSLLLAAALLGAPALSQAVDITIGGQTGSQVFLPNDALRIYNFGVTNAGSGLQLSALNVQLKGGNSASNVDPVTVKIYSGLGGTGTVLATSSILASQLNSQFSVITANFTPITLAAGGYSVVVSTTNANTYYIKQGALFLSDAGGVSLVSSSWVQDSNDTGTATNSLTAAGNVLAQAALSTTAVSFGNFRVGDTKTQQVSLSNTALATGNNVTEGLNITSSSANAPATVSGLPATTLAQGASSNFTVALNTGLAGVRNGTIDLNYGSVKGTSNSTTTSTTSVGSGTINVTGTGFRTGSASVTSSSVDLGKFHVGASNLTGSTTLSNTSTADGFSEGLGLSQVSVAGGASVSNLAGVIAAGANRTVGLGLASVSQVGANSGTVTLGVVSSGSGTSGLSDLSLADQVINVSATGYSGQSIWSTDANGVWNSFDGWDIPGGKPGVDGSLSANDAATFGAAATVARTITLGAAVPTLRSLTFDNGSASYAIAAGGAGRIQLGTSAGNGALTVLAGNHSVAAGLELAQATVASVASGSRLLLTGALDGSSTLNKTGTGTLAIDGTGGLTGATTVSAGLLNVNGSISGSAVTVATTGTLGGSGTVGATTIQLGGTLAPGNSPGTLAVEGDLTWQVGGNYNWQVVNASGTEGSSWDLVTVDGDLILSALSAGNVFNINLWTLSSTGPDVNGAAINFNNQQSYTWTIARVTGAIIGFDASRFAVNLGAINGTSGWANDLGAGSIAIVQDGQDLNLVFSVAAIPEPSTYGLLLGAGALAFAAVRRRRRA